MFIQKIKFTHYSTQINYSCMSIHTIPNLDHVDTQPYTNTT